MKRLLKQKLLNKRKRKIRQLYIADEAFKQIGFNIGDKYSYEVDFDKQQVRVVPNLSLERHGTVSRKPRGQSMLPLLDMNNKLIEKTFEGINQCQVTFFEDEVLIEAVREDAQEQPKVEDTSSLTFTQLCKNVASNVLSFAEKKKERQKAVRLKQSALNEILAKRGKKIAAGQLNLFDDFTFSEDVVTQTLIRSEEVQQQLQLLNKTLKVLSLFSGIGAFEEALKNLGIDHEVVNYCEIDEKIADAYSRVHNIPVEKNLGDIKEVDEKQLPDFDLMTWGFPCQDLSTLGKQKGFFNTDGSLTRSGLFFEAIRIAKHKKPRFMIVENVKALMGKKMKNLFDTVLSILKEIGYNTYCKVMNSKDYGVPQSRNRAFIVCIREDMDNHQFKFPEAEPLTVKASDWYDSVEETPDEVYIRPKDHQYISEERLRKKYSSLNSDVLICMHTKQGRLACPQNFVQDERGVRILTANELFKFQGFKASYGNLLREAGFKLSKIGYMLGNSITVNVVQKILNNLLQSQYQLSLV